MATQIVLGAVLAGGRSSRFGSDKALAMLNGCTLLDHAIAALSPHVSQVVVCGRAGGLADRPRPDLGPLGGLNAALHHAIDHGIAGVLTTGCDMPVYPAQLPALLIGPRAAVVEGQPLLGWWPATLAPMLDAHLAGENSRSIRGWLEAASGRMVTLEDIALPNINRPQDLAALQKTQ
ncbi:molybdenum cofactor guanylyltransferase [Sphingobium abikonense]|uniref:molybdenum cofactor guanylyltransferase n=1 Tax=Sphingobium abikonense TaxID=86193 RepID=UPI0035179111